ncbi:MULTISPECIES: VIT1/CCC1 transporter family protein [Roseomonadaceae]|uniref:VIT1/CCC1 transporter family protein n=1 Tax=Falsiroseomonas oleicola TaxID=2801474 RepID=A0ABS6HAR7_9PROT|nr:VIT1/CCC1 transporter family protein [Roseomonas oleicola]MBU8545436.1 VIT1/CCC1 transporter family protein [Roseomonas oleicola]
MLTAPTAEASRHEPSRDGLPPMPPGPPHEEGHVLAGALARGVTEAAMAGLVLPVALGAALTALGVAPAVTGAAGVALALACGLGAGLSGSFASRDAAAHYQAERLREEQESHLYPDRERWEVAAILHRYGVRGDILRDAVEAIASDRRRWVDFMMRFELDLSEPDPIRADRTALAGGAAMVLAGLLVMLPYLLGWQGALAWSWGLGGLALCALGGLRAAAQGLPPLGGAARALAIGAAATGGAWVLAKLVG